MLLWLLSLGALAVRSKDPKDPKDLAKIKPPHSSGMSLDHPEHLIDGDKGTYTTQLSKGKHFLQWNFRGTYELSTFAFRLEEGVVYPSFEILVSDKPTKNFKSVHKEQNFKQTSEVKWIFIVPTVKASHIRFVVDPGDGKETKFNLVQIWGIGDYDESPTKYDGTRSDTKYTKLVWSDYFEGNSLDFNKWHIVENETWAYFTQSRKGVRILKDGENSYLALKCKDYGTYEKLVEAIGVPDIRPGQVVNFSHLTWMCARVKTRGIFPFAHGRVVIRAKCDGSRGHWPALWMYPDNERMSDEIDILETPHFSYEESYHVYGTNHYGVYGLDYGSDGGIAESYEAVSENFHVYEVEWDLDAIKWYYDGVHYYTTKKGKDQDGMHNMPFYLIMEAQMSKNDGGGWPQPPVPGETDTDTDFLIDWVKVYQSPVHNRTYTDQMLTLSPTANPDNPYIISPCRTSGEENFISFWNGSEYWQDVHHFSGDWEYPRPFRKRVSVKEGKVDQFLVWHVEDVRHAFFLAHYRVVNETTTEKQGTAIVERLVGGKKLNFTMYVSPTGEDGTWQEHPMKYYPNFVSHFPHFSLANFDAHDIPDGMNYVKLAFPNYVGVQYRKNDGTLVDVVNTDIQLSKAIFTKVSSGPD